MRVSVRCVRVTHTHVCAHHASGSITDIDVDDETGEKLYHITYDDGDEEDLDYDECIEALSAAKVHQDE